MKVQQTSTIRLVRTAAVLALALALDGSILAASNTSPVRLSAPCDVANRQVVALIDDEHTQEAGALLTKLLRSSSDDLCQAVSLNNMSIVQLRMGRLKPASESAHRAVSLFEQVLGVNHTFVLRPLQNLAQIAFANGAFKEAEQLLNRMKDIPTSDPEALGIQSSLRAGILSFENKFADAEGYYRHAVSQWQRIGSSNMVPDLGNLSILYSKQGRYEEALNVIEAAIESLEPMPKETDVRVRTYFIAALAAAHTSDRELADSYFRHTLELLTELPPYMSPLAHMVCLNYHAFLQRTGHKREARELVKREHDLIGPDPSEYVVDVSSLASKLR